MLRILGIIFIVLGVLTLFLTGFSAFFVYIPLIVIGVILLFVGKSKSE